MTSSESMSLGECLNAITRIVEHQTNAGAIRESLRLSRLKLGETIERLETWERKTDILRQIHGHAESVAIEIDALLKAVQGGAAG
jgi:hypothetical protein